MKEYTKELTKEQWENDTVVVPAGFRKIKSSSENDIFGVAITCGYGLYGTRCYEKDGKYFVDYTTGSTCD